MANKIFELRRKLGLTQVKFGKLLKLRQGTISLYESGKADPSNKVCITLIKIFAKKKIELKIKDIKF